MFDRNSLIGLALIFLLFLGYAWYTQPSASERAMITSRQDSISQLKQVTDSIQEVSKSTNSIDSTSAIADTMPEPEANLLTMENDKIRVTLSDVGGKIVGVALKDYNKYDNTPTLLINNTLQSMGLEFSTNSGTMQTNNKKFVIINSEQKHVRFRLFFNNDPAQFVEYDYVLKDNSHVIDYTLFLHDMGKVIPKQSGYMNMVWNQKLNQQEADLKSERNYTTVQFFEDEFDNLSTTKTEDETTINKAKWVSFKQQFFNTTLINPSSFSDGKVSIKYNENDTSSLKQMMATMAIPFEGQVDFKIPMQLFVGPNQYNELKNLGIGAEKVVPLGWGIFGWVNKFLILPIFNFLNNFISNYGIIILILTIIVKLLTFPLTYRTYVASAKMRLLKPDVDKLKEKYKDDPQKLQMEQMKMQSAAGVSPLGGCLPQLFQMPIWIAMYQFFPSAIDLRQQPFLWAKDLSTFDHIINFGFNIPLIGNHISLFCLLFCLSQLLMSWYMMKTTDMPDQFKVMQYFFPIMMFFFLNNTSSGLNWYLFAGNIVTFVMQYVSNKFLINNQKLMAEIESNRSKPKKKSMFQQRMEEAMKQREQMQKNKN